MNVKNVLVLLGGIGRNGHERVGQDGDEDGAKIEIRHLLVNAEGIGVYLHNDEMADDEEQSHH